MNQCGSITDKEYTVARCPSEGVHEARFGDGSIGWYCDNHIVNALRNGAFVDAATSALVFGSAR